MKKQNIGSSFDVFLNEEGTLEDATAVAVKRLIAWQIAQVSFPPARTAVQNDFVDSPSKE